MCMDHQKHNLTRLTIMTRIVKDELFWVKQPVELGIALSLGACEVSHVDGGQPARRAQHVVRREQAARNDAVVLASLKSF